MLQKQTLTMHFYLSTHTSEKLVFALSWTQTHVSLITSRVRVLLKEKKQFFGWVC